MVFVPVSVLGSVLSLAQLAATLSVSKNNFGNPSTEQPEPVAAPKYNIAFRGITDKNGFIVPEKLMEDLDRLNKRFNRTIVDIDALHPLAAPTAAPILDGPHRFVRRAPAVTTTSATPLPTSKGKKCSPGFLNKNACVKVCPDKLLADTKAATCVPCPAQATCKQGLVTTCQSGWLINPTKTACIACPTHAVCRNGVVSSCDPGLLINAQQTACGACPRGTICTGGKITSCQAGLLLNAVKACVACPAHGVCSNGALASCSAGFVLNGAKTGCNAVAVVTTKSTSSSTTLSATRTSTTSSATRTLTASSATTSAAVPTSKSTTSSTTSATVRTSSSSTTKLTSSSTRSSTTSPAVTTPSTTPSTTSASSTTKSSSTSSTASSTTSSSISATITTSSRTTASSSTAATTSSSSSSTPSASPSAGSCPKNTWSYYVDWYLKGGSYHGPGYVNANCVEIAAGSQGSTDSVNAVSYTDGYCVVRQGSSLGPSDLGSGNPGWESFVVGCCADNGLRGAPAKATKICRNILVTSSTISEADGSTFLGRAYKAPSTSPVAGTASIPLQYPDHTTSSTTGGFMFLSKASAGTPPQEFTILWDTGSPLFWVDGTTCVDGTCNGKRHYDNTSSSTYEDIDGTASRITYGDGTWASVTPFRDTVTVGGVSATDFYMAQADTQSPGWTRGATDGLFGMSFRGPNSGHQYEATVIQQLKAQGVVNAGQFSMKYAYDSSAELLLGGLNPDLYVAGTTEWTSVTNKRSLFWGVQTTMQVNGVTIGGNNADAIVDSGTVYMVMVDAVAAAAFASIPGWGYYQNSAASKMYTYPCATPPVFTFSFPGGSTAWTISEDTLNLGQVDDTNCLASLMGGADAAAGGAGHILGDAFMQNVYTTFDSDNARVGFSQLS